MQLLGFTFLSMVWGTTWVAIKYSLQGFPPFSGAAVRFAVAIILLFLYSRYKGISLKLPRNTFVTVLLTAILLYVFDYGLIYWGEQYLYAGVTAIFFATFPLFTGVLSNFIFKSEPFQWNKFFGLLLGFCGVSIIFYDQFLLTNFNGLIIVASAGVLISALSAAVSTLTVKKYLGDLQTVSLTLHQMIWGVIFLGAIGIYRGELLQIRLTWQVALSVGYLGVVASALAFVVFYSLLKKMSAVTLSYIIYITPLMAVLTGWVFLREAVTLRIMGGAFLIFGGIAISQMQIYRKALKIRKPEIQATPEPTVQPLEEKSS